MQQKARSPIRGRLTYKMATHGQRRYFCVLEFGRQRVEHTILRSRAYLTEAMLVRDVPGWM